MTTKTASLGDNNLAINLRVHPEISYIIDRGRWGDLVNCDITIGPQGCQVVDWQIANFSQWGPGGVRVKVNFPKSLKMWIDVCC